MRVLLVQDNLDLGRIWQRFLVRHGLRTDLVGCQDDAVEALTRARYAALILEPELGGAGGGFPVADYATFCQPDIVIVAVTKSTFFSEGTIFELIPNARGVLRAPVRPNDLLAYLEHYAGRGVAAAAAADASRAEGA